MGVIVVLLKVDLRNCRDSSFACPAGVITPTCVCGSTDKKDARGHKTFDDVQPPRPHRSLRNPLE